jgi:hypothetical protein
MNHPAVFGKHSFIFYFFYSLVMEYADNGDVF